MASAVRDLELDLDAFEGPFDLLLTLLLKDAIEPAEVDMAAIVVAFVERLAEQDSLDLDACGEFLVLIAALLELKARHLFPDEEAELSELEPQHIELLMRDLEERGIEVVDRRTPVEAAEPTSVTLVPWINSIVSTFSVVAFQ